MRYLILIPLLAACTPTSGNAPFPQRSGTPVSIQTGADAEAYVLRVIAENGCRMSLDAFNARRAADGLMPGDDALRGPGGLERLKQASFVDVAPFALIERGVLVADADDPRIVTSRGTGCA